MEQRTLFSGFLRWFEEAPCPSERDGQDAYAAALAWRATCAATGAPPGPVHLNLPFREPLLPAVVEPAAAPRATARRLQDFAGLDTAPEGLAAELQGIERGVLLFGPDARDEDLAPAARSLAEALGWPVIADPASGLRGSADMAGSVIHGADLMLRDVATASALRPDLVLRFGGQPTSASLNAWMTLHASAETWLVDPAAAFRDPQHRATRLLRTSPRRFCELAAAHLPPPGNSPAWRAEWQRADIVARAAATGALAAEGAFLTPHIAAWLWARLPDGATLYAANSMAVRDVDAFAGPRETSLRLLANRGVSGIDGLISSALGAAAAQPRPTVLWCGDLAFLHDVSGLLAGKLLGSDLTVVVSNDDGGGIFEYLPVARAVPRPMFEQAFAMPHGADLCEIARGFGWQAQRTDSRGAFEQALASALAGGRHLIEVPVARAANTAFHRALYDQVCRALQQEPLP